MNCRCGLTCSPETKGRHSAAQGVLASVVPGLHRRGMDQAAGFPKEKLRYPFTDEPGALCPAGQPLPQLDSESVKGAALDFLAFGNQGVCCSIHLCCAPRLCDALCTELSGEAQCSGTHENASFLLHAGSSTGGVSSGCRLWGPGRRTSEAWCCQA